MRVDDVSGGPGWDVVVVGGGPAGSVTGARLARYGHRVLLLDRARFPRPKPCGECLNPAAIRELDRLGVLEQVHAAGAARIAGWRVHPSLGPAFEGTFPDAEFGLGVSRAVLDDLLLGYARGCGVEVRQGVRVADLLREGGRVAGVRTRSREIRARLVVGADGLRSVVVRRLNLLKRAPRLRKLALAAHVRGAGELVGRGAMFVLPDGCVGVADVGDGTANVVVVAHGAEAERVAGDRDGYFDRAVAGIDLLAAARRIDRVLATGPFDWPTRRAVADGALLVGDAAGYYDPFTGQGIFRALRGADLAAAAIDDALRRDDVSAAALAPYERARRRAFAPGERLQRVIETATSCPRLFGAVAGRFARRPALADALVAVTGDVKPFRSLLAPRLLAQWI
jgi:menaquinone-9 beta-reductase